MLPKKSISPMPENVTRPVGCTQATTTNGPHGGGVKFYQSKIVNNKFTTPTVTGHTQKSNTTIK